VTRKIRGKTYDYYAVRFIDPGTGKERLRYCDSRKEAARIRTDIEARLEGGTYNSDTHRILVREMVERFRKAGYFPRGQEPLRSTTVADYETALEQRILPKWGATRFVSLRASMIEAWRDEMLQEGVGKSPVRKALIVMGRLYRFGRRDHIVSHIPTTDVSKPTVRSRNEEAERLSPEQLLKLFDVLTGRTRVVVHMGARTGMREGEIFGLLWRDVDLENRRIRVRRQFTHGQFIEFPKTDAGVREVPMDAELVRVLTDWKLSLLPERKQLDSLVVATRGGPRVLDEDGESHAGGPISASNFLSREFYPALKAAKLPRVVFHSLRHTYKTVLVSTDTPPAVVHKILGHANFATTLKLYGGVLPQALERAGGKTGAAFEPRPTKTGQTNEIS
jgi:integrase